MTTPVPVSTNGVPAGRPFGQAREGSCPGCGYPRSQDDACAWCRTRPHQGYAPGLSASPTALAGSAWNRRAPEARDGTSRPGTVRAGPAGERVSW